MQTITTAKAAKQRKMIFQAPDHRRNRLFGAPLSPELKASHAVRTLAVRSGDTVRVMRGDHKGFEGKVSRVDRSRYRVYVEGLTREKVDGTTIFVPVHPSKVMITSLNLDDKWRKQILERKKGARRGVEKAPERPTRKRPKEVAVVKEKPAKEKVEKKPPKEKPKRAKKEAAEKPVSEETEKKTEEAGKEEKPKTKRPRVRRKTTRKTEGEA